MTHYHIYLNNRHKGTIYDISIIEKDPHTDRLFLYRKSILDYLLTTKTLVAIIRGKLNTNKQELHSEERIDIEQEQQNKENHGNWY